MPPRDDDEYDDRPRRRRDEDDDYDHPRPKKSGNTGLIIGLVVGGVVLLMLCGGVLLVALMLPAMSKVREAAGRATDQNNLKQVSLAMHNDLDQNGQWVAPYAHDQRGTVSRGLSFRVSLLPYIEQESLHRSFDFTQPWDSPRNRPHSDTPLQTYTAPFDGAPRTTTPYRAFVGGGALFDMDGKPVNLAAIRDGTGNTIMLVHAADQVPWAQPKELPYSPSAPLPALGHPSLPDGTNVVMADGSVRFLSKSTSEAVMRALITRAGGEQIPPGW